jgi:hypothetical protein
VGSIAAHGQGVGPVRARVGVQASGSPPVAGCRGVGARALQVSGWEGEASDRLGPGARLEASAGPRRPGVGARAHEVSGLREPHGEASGRSERGVGVSGLSKQVSGVWQLSLYRGVGRVAALYRGVGPLPPGAGWLSSRRGSGYCVGAVGPVRGQPKVLWGLDSGARRRPQILWNSRSCLLRTDGALAVWGGGQSTV